jgi:hypothetical protein
MATKYVAPSFGAASFSCPHCGALAHQEWFVTRAVQMSRDRTPKLADEGVMQLIRNDSDLDRVKKAQLIRHFERAIQRELFLDCD